MSVQTRVTAYWDERGAEAYDAQPSHGTADPAVAAAWRATVARALPATPFDLLDLGTGTGFIAIIAADLGHRVTATDLSEGMLELARVKAAASSNPPHFLLGDAVHPDFLTESFDAITSRHLLWTLVDPETAAANWLALLRPGGRLLAWDALWWQAGMLGQAGGVPVNAAEEAWRRHYGGDVLDALPLAKLENPDPVVALLERAGFVDVRLTTDPALDGAQRAARSSEQPDRHPSTMLISASKPGR